MSVTNQNQDTTTKTSTQRVGKLREDAKAKGWKRREYYATPQEHDRIKNMLSELRSE